MLLLKCPVAEEEADNEGGEDVDAAADAVLFFFFWVL